jgi:hypothetical protein
MSIIKHRAFNLFALLNMLIACAGPLNVIADPGDELVTTSTIVNLREQPSMESTILLKLAKDRRLTEVTREGAWVEVYTDRADIGTGWIHASLVAPLPDYNTALSNHTDQFIRFRETFNNMNESWRQQHGSQPFLSVDEYTHRRIRITATAEWLQTDQTQREQMLATLFDHWSDTVPAGLSIEITVIAPDGATVMSMFR